MKKTCLGFPIKTGKMKHRLAKELFRSCRVSGLTNFRLSDYDKLSFKVGDIAHDCDGFNHKIAKIVPYYTTVPRSHGKVLYDFTFLKEDGSAFCHATKAVPAETIRSWINGILKIENDVWGWKEKFKTQYGENYTISEDGIILKGE